VELLSRWKLSPTKVLAPTQTSQGGISRFAVAALTFNYACKFAPQEGRDGQPAFGSKHPGFAKRFLVEGECDVS
jgi:hypothetical protein